MKKKSAELYSIYLIVLFGFLFVNVVIDFLGGISINFSHISNFIDCYTIIFMFIFCFAALLFTHLLKPFANSFLFIFKNLTYSIEQYEQCILSIKVTMISSLIGGGIYGIATIMNMLSTMNDLTTIVICIVISLLAIFYSLVVCAILLPIYVLLKKEKITCENTNTYKRGRKS